MLHVSVGKVQFILLFIYLLGFLILEMGYPHFKYYFLYCLNLCQYFGHI